MLQLIRMSQTQKLSYVKILCDSQAAILALDSKEVRSRTVQRAIEALNSVADITISTRLEWVKAHIGIEGNKEGRQSCQGRRRYHRHNAHYTHAMGSKEI